MANSGIVLQLQTKQIKMKESLHEKLVSEISRIDAVCEQLKKDCMNHKEYNDFENALKKDIKWRQLKIVSQNLKKLL